ncbi:MAG TPA: outer membrane lipoprotein carrier protein LolA [Desulfovibrio sp.]|nr:outer membrane lipoprotein carrier protein LolA [Desulfovibrio sp.]
MKRFLFTCFFAFCLVFPALAETSLLHEVEQAYQNMKNFKAEFKQELFHRESNTTQTRTGTLEFMPETFIFWETNAPNRELIVCNDKEVWNYLPDEELAYHYSPKVLDTSHAILNVITGQAKLEDGFETEFLSENTEKNTQQFTLYPLEPNPQLTEITLTVNTKTKRIQKIVVLDFFGNLNTIEFTNFNADIALKKSRFYLSLPDTVEIEDHFGD